MATRTVKLSWKKVCQILRAAKNKRCTYTTYNGEGSYCAVGIVGKKVAKDHSKGYKILDRLPFIDSGRPSVTVYGNNDTGLTFKKNAAELEKMAKAKRVYTKEVLVKV